MMEGGQDEWTTIDRKTSKKKSSKEETKPVVVEDGWEQVNKKDKRKKDSVVSQGGQDYKGRRNGGGQRGGGRGRGGDRSDSGSNKGTLPKKKSSKEETKPVVVEDGWEQVNKKDKRKKDSVVSQ